MKKVAMIVKITKQEQYKTCNDELNTKYFVKMETNDGDKGIFIKLSDVTVYFGNDNENRLQIKNISPLDIRKLDKLDENIKEVIAGCLNNISVFNLIYTNESGIKSLYTRKTKYSMFYDESGDEMYENRPFIGDIIIKLESFTVNSDNVVFINTHVTQGLVKSILSNKRLLLDNFEDCFGNL